MKYLHLLANEIAYTCALLPFIYGLLSIASQLEHDKVSFLPDDMIRYMYLLTDSDLLTDSGAGSGDFSTIIILGPTMRQVVYCWAIQVLFSIKITRYSLPSSTIPGMR